jgi:hypothetical protein
MYYQRKKSKCKKIRFVDKPLNLISIKNRIPFFLKAKKYVYDEAFKGCPKNN